jgi:hypothetical protein
MINIYIYIYIYIHIYLYLYIAVLFEAAASGCWPSPAATAGLPQWPSPAATAGLPQSEATMAGCETHERFKSPEKKNNCPERGRKRRKRRRDSSEISRRRRKRKKVSHLAVTSGRAVHYDMAELDMVDDSVPACGGAQVALGGAAGGGQVGHVSACGVAQVELGGAADDPNEGAIPMSNRVVRSAQLRAPAARRLWRPLPVAKTGRSWVRAGLVL